MIRVILLASIVLTYGCHRGGEENTSRPSFPTGERPSEHTAYIERADGNITLNEWNAFVVKSLNLRISKTDLTTTNPKTGQEIRFINNGGDTEWRNPGTGKWTRVFFWGDSGRVFFDINEDFSKEDSPFRRKSRQIAESLDALVVDEYGTEYR